jgi:hypothetical protein
MKLTNPKFDIYFLQLMYLALIAVDAYSYNVSPVP